MQLIDNANKWYKLWSIRFAIGSAVLAALEASLPLWNGLIEPQLFATLSGALAMASAISRVIQQPKVHDEPNP